MPNPWFLIAAGIFWVVSCGGAYVKGQTTGANRVIAEQAKVNKAIDETRAAAQEGAANAIAQIRVTNTTVRGKTETLVREKTVYRDCVADDGVVRNINTALTGRTTDTAGAGSVSATVGAK